ncbi:Keratin, type II cytoskeletal 6B [Apodemus speciosus]|uniref:Keratin, type II cytoskeletal 6B n=1 Tax=Apodemus speciosus TaxID=105296 RepID=A0ABQ0FL05_APOSI
MSLWLWGNQNLSHPLNVETDSQTVKRKVKECEQIEAFNSKLPRSFDEVLYASWNNRRRPWRPYGSCSSSRAPIPSLTPAALTLFFESFINSQLGNLDDITLERRQLDSELRNVQGTVTSDKQEWEDVVGYPSQSLSDHCAMVLLILFPFPYFHGDSWIHQLPLPFLLQA